MDKKTLSIGGIIGFTAGLTMIILMGQAKPGNVIYGDRVEWTWTTAQASALLKDLPATIGAPISDVTGLACRAVSAEEWQCSATYQKQAKIEDLAGIKALKAAEGKAIQILDVAATK